jgi:small subunit ribosomal protein S18
MTTETETETTISSPEHHVDYKDITTLKGNVNPHARMLNRRRTGMTAKGQRNFARAIKRARFMALVPYIKH